MPERWAAGIDSVGSTTLASAIAATKARGAIAACGLAGGMDLPTSVAPFILRGIALLGVDSVQCPMPKRVAAWERLARTLESKRLDAMTQTVSWEKAFEVGEKIRAGQVRGRVVLEVA